jgi:plastocyanin
MTARAFPRSLAPSPARRRTALALGASIVLAVGLAGCGSAATSSAPAATAAGSAGGAVVVVKMTDKLRFDPATISIKIGTTVRWENASSMDHTSTDDASKAPDPSDALLPAGATAWDSGLIAAGATFEQTFAVAGSYTYFCEPHASAGMVGHITVAP